MEKKISLNSPFIGRSDGEVFLGKKFNTSDIKEYKVVGTVVKTGEGEHDFYVRKKMVLVKSTNRDDYINSFEGDVGILNALRKAIVAGESVDDIVKSGRFSSTQKGLVDISDVPKNIVEAHSKVEDGVKAFDDLPDKLKKKQSFAAFVENFDDKSIKDFISSEIERIVKKDKKEGV